MSVSALLPLRTPEKIVHAAADSSPPGHVMPPEKVHEKLFDGSCTEFKKPQKPAVKRYNKRPTDEQITKTTKKLLHKESKLRKRLAAHGIDYDFPGFVSEARLDVVVSDLHNYLPVVTIKTIT